MYADVERDVAEVGIVGYFICDIDVFLLPVFGAVVDKEGFVSFLVDE